MGEREQLEAWLRRQGQSEKNIAAHARGLTLLRGIVPEGPILPRHVDEALHREETAGASAQRLANLKIIGDRIATYFRERVPAEPEPATEPAAPPAARAVKAPPPRTTSWKGYTEQRACECPPDTEIWMDDGKGAFATATAVSGVVGYAVVFYVGLLGAVTVFGSLIATSALASALTVRYRCTQCRKNAAPETTEERGYLITARAVYAGIAVLAVIAAGASAYKWNELVDESSPSVHTDNPLVQ